MFYQFTEHKFINIILRLSLPTETDIYSLGPNALLSGGLDLKL